MGTKQIPPNLDWEPPDLSGLPDEPTEQDEAIFQALVSTDLTAAQIEDLLTPAEVHHNERAVLGIHWHPESLPLDLIRRRVESTFPQRDVDLVIPTQHNQALVLGDYAGVEVDCFSPEFKSKVQLLLHFKKERLENADMLLAMLRHTFLYRSGQLHEFIDTVVDPGFDDRLQTAAKTAPIDEALVGFIRNHMARLKQLLALHDATTPREMIKNRLVRDYFDALRDQYPDPIIERIQHFLKAVKAVVKANFNISYFYQTRDIIAEARHCGAGIIVPHPEQFWPILLADYDIDGIEVWNPQSRAYTEFLISAVQKVNGYQHRQSRPTLITMGDDCHMGEKTKPARHQDPEKAGREIGVQPAWQEMAIAKELARVNITKQNVIEEYRSRLT
jgi:hypothetical protein